MAIKTVLCVCKGNRDRSPGMAAVLEMFLRNAGITDVVCSSCGILESAADGSPASSFAVKAASRIGIDISGHSRRKITYYSLNELNNIDLFVCVDETVATKVLALGVDIKKIHNAEVSNPWPSQFQEDHDATFQRILAAMYKVVTRYFSD